MIQILPMFVLAIGLFPFFLLQRIRSSERRWNPARDIQRYQNRLLLDVLPLLTVLAPVLLFLAFKNRTFDNQSYVPAATTSSPVRLAMQFGAAAILTVVAFSLVLAKRVGATVGSLVAGVGISIAALFADASISKAHDFVRENGTPQPFTLRFELPDDVDGAEIEVNGVHLGTLPIELTVDELFHRVPPMSDVELKDFNSKDNPVTEWVFDENGMHGPGYKYWQSCHLQLPNGVSAKYPTSVKVRISANGEAGFGLNSFARRSLAHGNSYVFDLRFASWEEQINSLFDQARMSDYRVSIEWLDAWESWKWWSWNYLQSRIDNEPELTRIVDQLAEYRYHIKSIVTEEAAWSLLKKNRRRSCRCRKI